MPAIGTAAKLTTKPVNVFKGLGGVQDWTAEFPKSCQDPSPWAPCAWFCDPQSCDQCHPNNNVRGGEGSAPCPRGLLRNALPDPLLLVQGYTQLAMTVKAGLGL